MVVVGGVESDYGVSPRPLLQFLQFFQFMSDRLLQVMPGYIRLCQFMLEGRDVELDNKTFFIMPSHNFGCIKSHIGSIDLSESQSRMKIFDTNISMFGSNSLSPTTRVTSNQARREGQWTMVWTIPLLDMTWIWLGYDQLDCWKLPGSHEIITPDSHGVAQCLQTECWVPDQAADCGNCLCAMVWNLSHRQTYSFNCYAKLTK